MQPHGLRYSPITWSGHQAEGKGVYTRPTETRFGDPRKVDWPRASLRESDMRIANISLRQVSLSRHARSENADDENSGFRFLEVDRVSLVCETGIALPHGGDIHS